MSNSIKQIKDDGNFDICIGCHISTTCLTGLVALSDRNVTKIPDSINSEFKCDTSARYESRVAFLPHLIELNSAFNMAEVQHMNWA